MPKKSVTKKEGKAYIKSLKTQEEDFIKSVENRRNAEIKLYTQSELNTAVEAEQEALIIMFNDYMDDDNYSLDRLFKAIRARSKQ